MFHFLPIVSKVTDKKHKLGREKLTELGQKMELDKAELRTLFPVVQRLTWTKWTNIHLFYILWKRHHPIVRIFANVARPSKKHRERLWEGRLLIAFFVCSWSVLGSHSALEDGVAASETPMDDLLAHPWKISFAGYWIV